MKGNKAIPMGTLVFHVPSGLYGVVTSRVRPRESLARVCFQCPPLKQTCALTKYDRSDWFNAAFSASKMVPISELGSCVHGVIADSPEVYRQLRFTDTIRL